MIPIKIPAPSGHRRINRKYKIGPGGLLCERICIAGNRCGQVASTSRSGFPSAEALALYRLNALDASVKSALEHGV